MRKKISFIPTAIALLLVSCTPFLAKESLPQLRSYEKSIYVLKQDAVHRDYSLKKGQRVRLHLVTGSDFIKVYCYSADTHILKAERILVLYLFDSDFPKKIFDPGFFEEKLSGIAVIKSK